MHRVTANAVADRPAEGRVPAGIDLLASAPRGSESSRVVVLAQGLKIRVVQLDLERGAVLVQVVE
jgi:hypothetical protein